MATAVISKKTVQLQERIAFDGKLQVDAAAGVIRNVKVLGLESKNGRTYPAKTIREAASLYEGAKVNVNHPKGSPLASRDYQDRLGTLENVRVEDGLRADLHFNPKHAIAEQLAWDAAHKPENVGLSHNVEARTSKKDGKTIVEAILKVQSVDLVADPATTNSLYESTGELDMSLTEMTLEEIVRARPDLKQHIAEELKSGQEAKAQIEKLTALEAENKTLKAKIAAVDRKAIVDKKITEAKLPPDCLSPLFAEQCYAADDAGLVKLIEDRQALGKRMNLPPASKPKSVDQVTEQFSPAADSKTYASRLRA